jgi:hypothetical protein
MNKNAISFKTSANAAKKDGVRSRLCPEELVLASPTVSGISKCHALPTFINQIQLISIAVSRIKFIAIEVSKKKPPQKRTA